MRREWSLLVALTIRINFTDVTSGPPSNAIVIKITLFSFFFSLEITLTIRERPIDQANTRRRGAKCNTQATTNSECESKKEKEKQVNGQINCIQESGESKRSSSKINTNLCYEISADDDFTS